LRGRRALTVPPARGSRSARPRGPTPCRSSRCPRPCARGTARGASRAPPRRAAEGNHGSLRLYRLKDGKLSWWLPGATIGRMLSIGIKRLKNKLSEYVRLVSAGETVLVTDHDKVVAELVPPRDGRSSNLPDALLADAVRKGWITPALLPPGEPPPRAPVASLKR